jgi:hypothetical protein
MKTALNKPWHEKHRMPKNATFAQRVKWHTAHQKNCGCRPVPAGLLKQMKEKGLTSKG